MRFYLRLQLLIIFVFFLAFFFVPGKSSNYSDPITIDHTCTDLSKIPSTWIDSVKQFKKLHYAHTSHGSQLTHGLDTIETVDPFYDVAILDKALPVELNSFCIFKGQENLTYITPEQYWATAEGMNETRDVLNHNPEINVSMFAWCTQMSSATEEYVNAYLDSMTLLESEFPDVVFVYMTGNAQSAGAASNRYARNEQIRLYCLNNGKVLFDFADLDCWWYNPNTREWEYNTYTDYWGNVFPHQHPQFDGDEVAHTTWESCEQKSKALWWLTARLASWPGDTINAGSISWGELKKIYNK